MELIVVLERLSLVGMNFEMETFELNNENWIQVDFWIWSLYLNFVIFTILKMNFEEVIEARSWKLSREN